LFAVLFTDGLGAHVPRGRAAFLLPARALLVGLPLTVGLNALVCRFVGGEAWGPSWTVALCLGPTDPVLASALIGREAVPARLRSLLNVESGFNDGLVFPALAALLAVQHGGAADLGSLALDLGEGVALGAGLSVAVVLLWRIPVLDATEEYRPLLGFGAATTIFALALRWHANEYLAAFGGGLTIAFAAGELTKSFARLTGMLAELLKLGALLLFGLLVTPRLFSETSWREYVAAVLMLALVRPAALAVALARAGLDRGEWITAAWFGPKGFASVVYGLLVLHSNTPGSSAAAGLIGVTVTLSIVAHSSTDVLVANWFERRERSKTAARGP
jgi:NhaP-type Na+/H+ or K+/H+ antiporter